MMLCYSNFVNIEFIEWESLNIFHQSNLSLNLVCLKWEISNVGIKYLAFLDLILKYD